MKGEIKSGRETLIKEEGDSPVQERKEERTNYTKDV